MKRIILVILPLLVGVAIGSCIAVTRGGTRPASVATVQDWRPVVGQRYSRLGARTRTVVETWPHGVAYRWDKGKERYCTIETWRRWAMKGGE